MRTYRRRLYAYVLVAFSLISWSAARANSEIVKLIAEREVPDCPSPCQRHAIVFIHGIWGSADTWKNAETGKSWLALIREDSDLSDFDIFRLDYATMFANSGPSAEVILESMVTALGPVLKRDYRSVQFITHSLGGLILRGYIVHLKSKTMHRDLSKIRLGLLMASPGRGSYWGDVARVFSESSALRILGDIKENDWAQLVGGLMLNISEKHESLGCPSLRLYGAYEEEKTLGVLVVNKESASSGVFSSEQPVHSPQGFRRNHSTIVKPRDANDEVYLWAKSLLRDCADAGKSCPVPKNPFSPDCYFEVH